MNFIVFDLEWNQCPQGKKYENPKLPFEIIEIGAIRMDADFRMLDSFHEIIRPQVYLKLNYMTRSVITLKESDFEGKRTFPEVITDFLRWCGKEPVFCTWGSGDLLELQRNMDFYRIPNPFPFPFFYCDIQKAFAIRYEDRHIRRALSWAVDYLKIDGALGFHSAWCDATYTAMVCQHLPLDAVASNYSVDYYRTPRSRKEEIHLTFESYTKFISRPFADRTDVMKDRIVNSTKCCVCGRPARRKIRWFSDGGRNFLCAAECPEHGLLKGKARIRQNSQGEWYVVKTIRRITPEEFDALRERQLALRERRKLHRFAEAHHKH